MTIFSTLFLILVFSIFLIGIGLTLFLPSIYSYISKNRSLRIDEFDPVSPDIKSTKYTKGTKVSGDPGNPPIYALMITGKDDKRIGFAKKAVMNFDNQDYPNKKLIIVNHHPDPQMKVLSEEKNDCLEIRMKKESLGHLRNVSLEFVPMNAYWTIWDDDDWRPKDYLSTLFRMIFEKQVDGVTYTTRYEHNLKTGFSWKMTSMKGYPTILCKQNPLIRYKDVDTMEDVDLIDDIRKIGLKVFIYHNADRPDLYVRLVHGNNSSLYINHLKTNVRPRHSESNSYKEDIISRKEKEFVVRSVQQVLNDKF